MKNWEIIDNKLCKTFVFKDFTAAMSWMVRAGFMIEKLNHHPEWTNVYNKIEVKLTNNSPKQNLNKFPMNGFKGNKV